MTLKSNRMKINKKNIILFLLLMPHLRPESFAYIAPAINTVYNIGRVISFAWLICIVLYKAKKPSPVTIAISLLQMWVVLTTFLNHGEIQRAFINMMSTISIMLIVDICAKKSIIKPIMLNFELLIYINLITVIFFPQGLYQRGVHSEFIDYFLGFKNSFFPYCIISILLAGMYYLKSKKTHLRALALMAASFFNVFLAWSASSLVAVAVSIMMFVLIVILRKPKFLCKLKFRTLFFSYIIMDILVCVINIVETVPFISSFVTNVLHKQTDLTGRTYIWGFALQAIKQQPLIGYGVGEHITWRGYNWYGHNQIFEMLMEGGIPCLILFLIAIFLVSREIDKCRNKLVYNILISVFSGIFVFYIVEAGVSTVFYLLFAIAYHINEIIESEKISFKSFARIKQ